MFYLKYRPQTIAELDVAKIRETLGKSLLDNKWAHAYLLIGNRGMGKTSTARLIAKIVNCTGRRKGEEPCNKCDSCRAIQNGSSLDVIEIDAASNTGVEDIRDLREKVKLAAVSGKYKVYIIDEVHMLSTSAFNALLKTLEEPPEHVIFVLATTDPHKLPATIVSRCLVFDFGSPTSDEIKRALKKVTVGEKIKIDEEALDLLVKKANGSLRDSHKILEQLAMIGGPISLEMVQSSSSGQAEEASAALFNSLVAGNREEAFNQVERFVRGGGKIKDLYGSLLTSLREVIVTNSNSLPRNKATQLINSLIASYSQITDSPIPQLPLELVLVDYFSSTPTALSQPEDPLPKEEVKAKASYEGTNKVVQPTVEEKREESAPKELKEPVVLGVGDVSPFVDRWNDILLALKPHNHSLVAFLKAARPKDYSEGKLILEVFYPFHKDQLSSPKNRSILESVISDIMGTDIQVKFELGGGK